MRNAPNVVAYLALLALMLVVCACEEPIERLRVERIRGPSAADALNVICGGDDGPAALARTPDHLWVYEDDEWRATRAFDGGMFATDAAAGGRDTIVWAQEKWWWLEVEVEAGPRLRTSANGREWRDFELPGTAREGALAGTAPASAAEPLAPLRLETRSDALFIVGPRRIWRLDQSGEPIWHRVDLGGVGLLDEAATFPAFIRNYLPRTAQQPFELLTVFGEQLRVYRRYEPDARWMMVSSVSVVDQRLLTSPDGGVVFMATADGVRRSNDEGETWFRFWPSDAAPLTAFTVVADSSGKVGYALVAGTADGSILRSGDDGTTWAVVRPGGPSQRSVSALDTATDLVTVWAATRGRGVWVSRDGGKTFEPRNKGLTDARPVDVDHRDDGSVILADRGGVWTLADGLGRSWNALHSRTPASVVGTESGLIVTGTVDGTVVVQTSRDDMVEVESLFRDGKGPLVKPNIGTELLGDRAVVAMRARPDSDELQAWSKAHGAAISTDNGAGWEQLPLDESLTQALDGRPIVDVQLDSKRGIYLTVAREGGIEIWYSHNGGTSWKAVREVDDPDARLLVLGPRDADAMVLVADGQLQRSLDAGATWSVIDGPWANLSVVGMAYDRQTLALLVDSRPGFEVMRIREPVSVSRTVRRFALEWPNGPPRSAPKDIELDRGSLLLTTREAVWRVARPGEESPLPYAATLLAMALSVLAACAIVFFAVRRI
jgi:hypothetical protein